MFIECDGEHLFVFSQFFEFDEPNTSTSSLLPVPRLQSGIFMHAGLYASRRLVLYGVSSGFDGTIWASWWPDLRKRLLVPIRFWIYSRCYGASPHMGRVCRVFVGNLVESSFFRYFDESDFPHGSEDYDARLQFRQFVLGERRWG